MDNIITLHEAQQRKTLRLPLGCDEQGRYPEAAHAATDIDTDMPPLSDRAVRVVAWGLILFMFMWGGLLAWALVSWVRP